MHIDETKTENHTICPIDSREIEEVYHKHKLFIKQYVSYYAQKYGYTDFKEDLMQIGVEALIHAMSKYDPSKNTKFITYLGPWLHLYLRNACLKNMYLIKVPPVQIYLYSKIKSNVSKGNTMQDAADVAGVSCEKATKLCNQIKNASVILSPGVDGRHCNEDTISPKNIKDSVESFEEDVIRRVSQTEMKDLLEKVLTPLESRIILRNFGFIGNPISLNRLRVELYPKYTSKILTRERLRQIRKKAFNKIKSYMEETFSAETLEELYQIKIDGDD